MKLSLRKCLYLVLSVLAFSCNPTESETFEVEDAKATLAESGIQIESDVIEIIQSTGIQTLMEQGNRF